MYKEPEMFSIYNFKKGDIITRVKAADNKTAIGNFKDFSLMGSKLIFLGLENGCIYLERTSEIEKMMQGQTFFIPIEIYWGGWNYYKEPEFLKGKGNITSMIEKILAGQSKAALLKMKDKALKEEDYSLLTKIVKKLNDLKKNEEDKIDLDNPDFLFGKTFFDKLSGGINMDDIDSNIDDDED